VTVFSTMLVSFFLLKYFRADAFWSECFSWQCKAFSIALAWMLELEDDRDIDPNLFVTSMMEQIAYLVDCTLLTAIFSKLIKMFSHLVDSLSLGYVTKMTNLVKYF
jgi:hypothetical protein